MSTNVTQADELSFAPEGRCACGFEPSHLGPLDAVETLRSLHRRWRSVLAFDLDAAEPEAVLAQRPSPTGWSALEHAGHVRDVMHALSIRLGRVLTEDSPILPETHDTPPSGANEQGPGVVLAGLAVTVEALAECIETTAATEWHRTGVRRGEQVRAIDLVREAIHEGVHHLREASLQLEQ